LHDFRRTTASWLAQAGYSELVIKKLLNHTVRGVTSVYAQMDPGAVREAVEDYGQWITVRLPRFRGHLMIGVTSPRRRDVDTEHTIS